MEGLRKSRRPISASRKLCTKLTCHASRNASELFLSVRARSHISYLVGSCVHWQWGLRNQMKCVLEPLCTFLDSQAPWTTNVLLFAYMHSQGQEGRTGDPAGTSLEVTHMELGSCANIYSLSHPVLWKGRKVIHGQTRRPT